MHTYTSVRLGDLIETSQSLIHSSQLVAVEWMIGNKGMLAFVNKALFNQILDELVFNYYFHYLLHCIVINKIIR